MKRRVLSLVLIVLPALVPARVAVGQSVMSWLDPRLVRQRPVVDYRQRSYFDEAGVRGQDAELGFHKQELAVTAPLYQDDEEQWRFTSQVWSLCLHNNATLPDTGEPVPDELWDIRVGGGYGRKLDGDKVLGVHATAGSASDRPFARAGQTALSATAFLYWPETRQAGADGTPAKETGWLTYLTAQSQLNGSGAYAFPGAGYYLNSQYLDGLFGVPVVWVQLKPAPPLAVQGLFIPSRAMLDATYEIAKGVALYATYDWEYLNFFRHDRADDDEQFYYQEQRVYAGVELELADNALLTLGGGYGFDRRFYESDNPFCGSQRNRFSVGDGAIAFVKLHMKF